jgi:hypothetical protein
MGRGTVVVFVVQDISRASADAFDCVDFPRGMARVLDGMGLAEHLVRELLAEHLVRGLLAEHLVGGLLAEHLVGGDSLRKHLARQADLGSRMCRATDESWEELGALLNQTVGPCWTEPTSCLCNNGYMN